MSDKQDDNWKLVEDLLVRAQEQREERLRKFGIGHRPEAERDSDDRDTQTTQTPEKRN